MIYHAPLREKSDIKIYILYLMKNIGRPIDYPTLHDIMTNDDIVSPFDFTECTAELMETGNIAQIRADGVLMYTITEQGIHVAENLQSDIMKPLRDRALKHALRYLSFKERGSQIVMDGGKNEDGSYFFQCSISEKGASLLELSVRLEHEEQLKKMQYHFDDKAEYIYKTILALLSGEVNYLFD